MAIGSRTITHYSLIVQQNKNQKEVDPVAIKNCLDFIAAQDKENVKYDDTSAHKFHFLASLHHDSDCLLGYFKSARYDYRPPLIDKDTLIERKSPKKVSEGESELTHFAIAIEDDDALLLLEQKRSGVSINTMVRYLNIFMKTVLPGHTIVAGLSVKGDFNAKLKELSRAVSVDIYMPHSVVTDTFENEPISTKNVKANAVITLHAEKTHSILSSAKDLYLKMTNHKADISRIKIHGKTASNTDILLDTNKLKDKNTVKVELDENNQVISNSMLGVLKATMDDIL